MCKHKDFKIETWRGPYCPWCRNDKLSKENYKLKNKLIDERETSRRVHKENLELQERLDRLGEQ